VAGMFGPDHPLWDVFISLRRNGVAIKTLVVMAGDYDPPYSLTWRQIYRGMQRAPATFGLPTKSALWLAHKYAAIEGKISAYKTMAHILGESLERLQKMHVDLAVADTPERRYALEHTYIPGEMKTAFEYAQVIASLDIEIRRALGHDVTPQGSLNVGTQNVIVLAAKDIVEFSRQLGQEFTSLISAGSAEEAAINQFGNDNVRAVDDLKADVIDEDEVE